MSADKNANNSADLKRGPGGRFAPGSGGRPKGAKNKLSNAALKAIQSLTDNAIIALVQNIAAGDMRAVEYVLNRVLPQGRTIELNGADPESITEALVNAEITTGEAKEIAQALAKLQEIGELAELKERIEALEAAANGKIDT